MTIGMKALQLIPRQFGETVSRLCMPPTLESSRFCDNTRLNFHRTSPTPFGVASLVYLVTGFSSGTECINPYSKAVYTQTYPATTATALSGVFTPLYAQQPTTLSGATYYFSGTTSTHQEFAEGYFTVSAGDILESIDDLPVDDFKDEPDIILDPPWYWLPGLDSTGNWTQGTRPTFSLSPDLMSFIVAQSSIKSAFPFITLCSAAGGVGAPTLHIPVAELTIERVTTIPVGGHYGSTGGGVTWNNVGKTSGDRMTTSTGNPVISTQRAQPHTITQAIVLPTMTTLPNPSSTLPMGVGSISPALLPEGQSSSSVSLHKEPHSTDGLGEGVISSGQPQSQRLSIVPNTGSGSGSVKATAQIASTGPQGSQDSPSVSDIVTISSSLSAHDFGSGASGSFDRSGTSQVGDGLGANILSALSLPKGVTEAAANRPGYGGSSENGQGDEYSVFSQRNSGQALVTTAEPVVIGGATATPIGPSAYVLPGGQTISAGGAQVVTTGKTLSLGTSGAIVVNGQTVSSIAAYQSEPGPVTFGNAIATPIRSDAVAIEGHTLSLGGAPVVVSGTTYSLGSSSAVIVDGHTLSKLPAYPDSTPVTISNAVFSPLGSNAYAAGGQTLHAGGTPITVSGNAYSLAPSGAIIVNGHTISSLPVDSEYDHPTSGVITTLTFGTAVFTATPAVGSALVIDGQTLIPGHAITVAQNGQVETISVPPDGLARGGYVGVVNGVTQSLASGQWLLTEPNGVVLTLSPTGVGELVVGGTTLVPGGAAVVSGGVTISEAPNGDVVEVSGGETSTVGSAKGSGGVGYYVHSGIGGGTTSAPAAFLGEGVKLEDGLLLRLEIIAALAFGIGALLL